MGFGVASKPKWLSKFCEAAVTAVSRGHHNNLGVRSRIIGRHCAPFTTFEGFARFLEFALAYVSRRLPECYMHRVLLLMK